MEILKYPKKFVTNNWGLQKRAFPTRRLAERECFLLICSPLALFSFRLTLIALQHYIETKNAINHMNFIVSEIFILLLLKYRKIYQEDIKVFVIPTLLSRFHFPWNNYGIQKTNTPIRIAYCFRSFWQNYKALSLV